jgi:hypothetical protein
MAGLKFFTNILIRILQHISFFSTVTDKNYILGGKSDSDDKGTITINGVKAVAWIHTSSYTSQLRITVTVSFQTTVNICLP